MDVKCYGRLLLISCRISCIKNTMVRYWCLMLIGVALVRVGSSTWRPGKQTGVVCSLSRPVTPVLGLVGS